MHTKTTNAATPDTQRCGFSRALATALMATGVLLLGLSVLPAAASAQIRCWTNDSGSRECSDMPPPPNAKGVNEIRGRAHAGPLRKICYFPNHRADNRPSLVDDVAQT